MKADGSVTVSATDQSLIVSISGAVAVTVSGSTGAGASISYNRISNGLAAYIDDATVTSNDGGVSVTATSTPLLVAVGAAGAGGKSTSGAGTFTINSVANTVDAHITDSSTVKADLDVDVHSSEAAAMYVAALAGAGSTSGSAIGESIAYNYIGGLSPLDPNVISFENGTVPGTTNASVTADQPIPINTAIEFPGPDGFNTGDEVLYQAGNGNSIGGLTSGQTYYVIVIDPETIELASSYANAEEGVAIGLTSSGGAEQSFTLVNTAAMLAVSQNASSAVAFNPSLVSVSDNQINLVTVVQGSGILTITSNTNTSTASSPPSNLVITGGNAETTLLGSSPTTSGNAISGSSAAATNITSSNDDLTFTYDGVSLTATLPSGTYTADSLATAVQSAINGAILNYYGVTTGTQVVYHDNGANGGTSIDGLTDGTSYYIIRTATNAIELASSSANATAGTAITLGPNLGSGIEHTFTPVTNAPLTFGAENVNAAITDSKIGFASDPGLYAGEAVVYNANGGTSIGGLTSGQTYYVIAPTSFGPSISQATS